MYDGNIKNIIIDEYKNGRNVKSISTKYSIFHNIRMDKKKKIYVKLTNHGIKTSIKKVSTLMKELKLEVIYAKRNLLNLSNLKIHF